MSIDKSGDQFINQQEYKGVELTINSSFFILLGKKIDSISIILFTLAIVSITILYYKLGLFTINFNYNALYVYISTIIYFIINIYTSPTEVSTTTVELEKLEHLDNSLLIILGSISLVYIIVFVSKIKKPDINILLISVIIALLGCLYPSGAKTSINYRRLRKIDEVFYTISISFFILYLILSFSTTTVELA